MPKIKTYKKLQEGDVCRYTGSKLEGEISPLQSQLRETLEKGTQVTVYEDYVYTCPSMPNWYFAMDEDGREYLLHASELQVYTEPKPDQTLLDWIESI